MFLLETEVQNGPHHSILTRDFRCFNAMDDRVETPPPPPPEPIEEIESKGQREPRGTEGTKLPSVQINVNHNIHYTSNIHNIFNISIYT